MTTWWVSVTEPIAVPWTSHFSQSASTSSTRAGSTTQSIRSCDSETMISNGAMSASRSGTFATSISTPTSPLDAISDADDVRPAAPRSCSETSRPCSSSSSEHSRSFFSSNGSPTWTRRALVLVGLAELRRRQHRRAADAVAAGRRAEQDEHVADAGGGAADHLVLARDAERHRVDQAVLLVRALEVDLAADGRHADRVAVVADARHRAVEQVARARAGRLAEAQRVEHGDRPRADREDVAQDAADAGGRALERLDRADGWLCDSTLNAIASPSPTSTAPAFSPGPMTTFGPSVGSVRRSFLECL